MKKLLGMQSLSGIVYTITEIPVDPIREIVDARIADLPAPVIITPCERNKPGTRNPINPHQPTCDGVSPK